MKVQYTGTADFQEFSAADFRKAGVEDAGKVRFAQGEPQEVSDAVGEALVSKEGLFGDFRFDKVEEEDDEDAESDSSKAKPASDDPAMTESGRASTSDTAAAGGRGRARGGTTRA